MPRATLWLLSQLFCFDVSIIILLFLTNISLTFTNKAMSATLHPSFDQNTIPQCNVLRHSWVIFSSALHRLKPLTRTTRGRSCQARCVPICINPALNQVIDGLVEVPSIYCIFAILSLLFWQKFGYFSFAWLVKSLPLASSSAKTANLPCLLLSLFCRDQYNWRQLH